MAGTSKGSITIDTLEPEIDRLINSDHYFGSISEDLRKLVHRVFFVHTRLESELGMRIVYKLFEEQIGDFQGRGYCLTETMGELIDKLTYTEKLTMVRGFKDRAPHKPLEKINDIRNDFGHPIERNWKNKYNSKASKAEVLQLLIHGIEVMNEYMEKVRRELGF